MDFEQAKVYHERGQLPEAQVIYDQLLNANFDNLEVLFYYGTLLFQQGKNGLASNILRMALDNGKNPNILQNLSNCYKAENNHEEAGKILKLALAQKETADMYGALGNLYINNGTPLEALKWYEKGLKLEPRNDLLIFHMGLAWLEMGDYEKGWAAYENGYAAGNRTKRSYLGAKEWDGSPGKRVIVWGEQGIGDEIMFASILPDMMRDCSKVIFDCHPRLLDTFTRSFPIEIHGTRKNQVLDWYKPGVADAHCSAASIATIYRKSKSAFPKTPYLKPNEEKVKKYRGGGDGRLRVGVSWIGGTKQTRMDLRTIKLEWLTPVLKQNCDFYSLQYTSDAAKDVCAFEELSGLRLKHFPGVVESQNYDATVNFIASLDGELTFEVEADDGYKFIINGNEQINTWTRNRLGARTCKLRTKKDTTYRLVLEYWQGEGKANVRLRPVSTSATALAAICWEIYKETLLIWMGVLD